jgi:hypothetical protein
MRNLRGVLASSGACALALAACGSTAQSNRTAAINAALRGLQAEVEQGRSKFNAELRRRGEDVLGSLMLVSGAPPKGVTRAEWEAALNKDQALQRALDHHGPPTEQPPTAELEQEIRSLVSHPDAPHPFIKEHGPLRSLSCRETTHGVWFCTMRFDDGFVRVERVTWYQNAGTLGYSAVSERKGLPAQREPPGRPAKKAELVPKARPE